MKIFLNIVINVSLVLWVIGFAFFDFGWGIHGLLLLSVNLYLVKLIINEWKNQKTLLKKLDS